MEKFAKTSATLLLMLCFGVSGLFYFFFDAAQAGFKIAAAESIGTGANLEIIRLPLGEFTKNKTGDEVWVNGRLYDISSYTVENDVVAVSVFHDKDEELLVKNMVVAFDQDGSYGADNSVHLGRHRLHAPDDTKILVPAFSAQVFAEAPISYYPFFYVWGVSQFTSSVIKPPPDLALS